VVFILLAVIIGSGIFIGYQVNQYIKEEDIRKEKEAKETLVAAEKSKTEEFNKFKALFANSKWGYKSDPITSSGRQAQNEMDAYFGKYTPCSGKDAMIEIDFFQTGGIYTKTDDYGKPAVTGKWWFKNGELVRTQIRRYSRNSSRAINPQIVTKYEIVSNDLLHQTYHSEYGGSDPNFEVYLVRC